MLQLFFGWEAVGLVGPISDWFLVQQAVGHFANSEGFW